MAKTEVSREAFDVFLDAADLGDKRRVGALYRQRGRSDLPASFEYDPAWLRSKAAFMLDPRLELWGGTQYPPDKASAFGIFMDSAPDRWGRVLMERREATNARKESRRARTLQEMDFLLGVADLARMGALRFRAAEGGAFLDDQGAMAAPPVTRLRELAAVSQRIEDPGIELLPEYEQWLAMLIAPGTSLGGARPKANFTDEGERLWLAKFPARDDRYDVGAWEFLVHQLAGKAGIWVPPSRLESLSDRYRTFCVARFDRNAAQRRMFASAMTLLERQDGKNDASYLDLAEFISDQGAKACVEGDLQQLFRRVIFNVLIGNRDDHLRNHGFLREPSGWRLSPAYDMNPSRNKAEHTLTLDGSTAAPDLQVVMDTGEFYRLDKLSAERILDEVRVAVSSWRDEASRLELSRLEVAQMEAVFL